MKIKKIAIGLAGLVVVASLFVVSPIYARIDDDSAQQELIEKQQKALQDIQENKQKALEQKKEFEEKRKEIRKKLCEKVGERTKKHYQQIRERAKKINERISSRVERAKAFVAKNNLTVENYEALLADIEAKKQAAIAAAQAIPESAAKFDCESDNAKTVATEVKAKIEAYKAAAKDYRAAVKTFLQAVKKAAIEQLEKESVSQNSEGNR